MNKRSCPAKKTFIRAFSNELPETEKFHMLDHITGCAECRHIFGTLKELWAKEKDIPAYLLDDQWILSRKNIIRLAKEQIRSLRRQYRTRRTPLFMDKRWASVLSGAAVIAAVLIIGYVFSPEPEPVLERTSTEPLIQLIQPSGDPAANPFLFKWTTVEDASHYTLELFDIGLERIYRADIIKEDQFSLPTEITARLEPGKIYFWKITVTLNNNEKIESDFGRLIY